MEDPLWAVCVDPQKKGRRWDINEFFASGRLEIDAAMAYVNRLGLAGGARATALDFGCGAGRLTLALAEHFEQVVGVDISRSMLSEAARHAGHGRCTYVHNQRPNLRCFDDDSFDLVYTSLVLQHLSRNLALAYISEFLRVVRPDGLVMLSVPIAPRPTAKAAVFVLAPFRWIRWIQQRVLHYPAPMRISSISRRSIEALVDAQGFRVLATAKTIDRSRDWRVAQFVISAAKARSESARFADAAALASPHALTTS
ncbi:class I SAM-dependent methyltransferase [Catenulispora yoronensis]